MKARERKKTIATIRALCGEAFGAMKIATCIADTARDHELGDEEVDELADAIRGARVAVDCVLRIELPKLASEGGKVSEAQVPARDPGPQSGPSSELAAPHLDEIRDRLGALLHIVAAGPQTDDAYGAGLWAVLACRSLQRLAERDSESFEDLRRAYDVIEASCHRAHERRTSNVVFLDAKRPVPPPSPGDS